MTELELRNLVVNTAKAYLGSKESNGSHKKIIDLYNAHRPLARGYAVKYTDAWCATFVSAVGIKLGLTDIMPTECGCGQMITLYNKLGRWKESDSYTPKPGDIIMYYWDDSGKGDATGWPDHVGIVVSVSGNTIKVIEGNISNAVGYRNIAVNGRYIRGYCLPDYASKTTEAKPEAGWVKDDKGWWYRRSDGTWPVGVWEEINGKLWRFDKKGYLLTNTTLEEDGIRYTFDENGYYTTADTKPGTPMERDEASVDRYELLKDVTNKGYRKTLDKLIEKGFLKGKGGEGENLVLDLGEDAVRILVYLDRAGLFD